MKEQFFARLEPLIAEAKRLRASGFDEQEPEEATKQLLLEPLFHGLGFAAKSGYVREFKILGDSVDYLLKSDRPLLFVEAKHLRDPAEDLFEAHREQVLRYIRNYRVSPEQTHMEQPVAWIVLTNFAQWHFVRVNEDAPSFSFTLAELWKRRDELWDLLAQENLEANRIDELYDQQHKATLDQRFLADLKRWRLLIANAFALRNQARSLPELTLASQQLLDRFIFCRMLETNRLIEWNKLARSYTHYEVMYAGHSEKSFCEVLRESLFQEVKFKFNTELFEQPILCDELEIDNVALAAILGHEPLAPELAATAGLEAGQGEFLAFRHVYSYDFSRMSSDVMGAVYERFLAHHLEQKDRRIVIEDTDELRKKEGIYYTPRYIVDYIIAHTLGEKIKPILVEAKSLLGYKNFNGAFAKICELSQIKVLDPAMGSGSFLLGAFDALVAAYADYNAECDRVKRSSGGDGGFTGSFLFDAPAGTPRTVDRLGSRVMSENIFGVDLDLQAVEVAKLNLWIRLMKAEGDALLMKLRDPAHGKKPRNLLPTLSNLRHGNSLIADADVAGDSALDWKTAFPAINGFDVVVGNPPYERIQTMQAHAPESVEFLKANYRSAASGNFDIYVCFIERGLQLLKADGQFGYICPHKFFQAEYGEPVRKLLSEGRHVRHILSFGDLQIFPQVSTYTCLLFLDKEPQPACRFVKVDDLDDWRATGVAQEGNFPAKHFSASEWNFALGASAPLFQKLSKFADKFSDVTERVFQGPITSADKVFLFEEFREGRKGCTDVLSQEDCAWVTLESKLLKRVVRAGNVGRYWAEATTLVLFPYEVQDNEAKLIPAGTLKKGFPLAWDYLSQHKKLLEDREDGSFRDEEWYRFGRTQNLGMWEQPKLLVPYMIAELGAHFDQAENFYFINVTTGGYGVTVNAEKVRLPYLCGLMNSRVLDFYLKQVSTNFRGGYFAANKQFLDKLPIKLIDPKKKSEVKLEKEIVERVEQIQAAHRQRVKLPEVLARLIAHSASRVPCNLAHYLHKDFAAAVQPDILIDDVQRTGFVHAIQIESGGKEITLTVTVSDTVTDAPRPLPVLRLGFQDETLRQFIYARWKHFLAEHSRQKKWTKGKKPEAVYPLLVNTLEPLAYFSPSAGDNLRALRELMQAVEQEAGSADLAALEAEIARLDREIDARVYELYGLTPEEIQIVAGTAK